MLRLADCRSILVDRVSHRSVHTAWPCWEWSRCGLPRPWRKMPVVTGPVEPEAVEQMLEKHPECGAVVRHLPHLLRLCALTSLPSGRSAAAGE